MLFQHGDRHTGPAKQITSHHPGWSATRDHATSFQFLGGVHRAMVSNF
jgi:hypothetical protein